MPKPTTLRVDDWLNAATTQLNSAGIGTARLDALILLEDISGKDRAWILANPDYELSTAQISKLKKLLTERSKHIPIAYLRGVTEFYTREFIITPAVLEPRPESETMIDLLKKLLSADKMGATQSKQWKIADVGSGSGALGITAKLELPESHVTLIDIDSEALKVSKMNVDKFTLDIFCVESDLLHQTAQDFDILLCNLPYVPDDYHINTAALHEPRIAIFGGSDGLDLYRTLFNQLKMVVQQPLYILCEALPPQHADLISIAASHGYERISQDDFIVVFSPN